MVYYPTRIRFSIISPDPLNSTQPSWRTPASFSCRPHPPLSAGGLAGVGLWAT